MLSISKVWLQFLGDFASQNLGPIRQLVQFSMATSETNSSEKLVDTAVWLTRRICLRSMNTIFWSRTFLTISVSHKYLDFDKAESSRILFFWGGVRFFDSQILLWVESFETFGATFGEGCECSECKHSPNQWVCILCSKNSSETKSLVFSHLWARQNKTLSDQLKEAQRKARFN